ncbi:MAG: ABC transporter permease [Gemmatimonadaceae bacterium]
MTAALDALGAAGGVLRAVARPDRIARPLQWQLASVRFVRQVTESALPLIGAAIATAALISFVLHDQLERFGLVTLVGPQLSLVLVREMAPVVASFVLLTRTAASLTAELATERVEGELDALDAMGLSSVELRLAPRVIAMTATGAVAMLVVTLLAVQTDLLLTRFRGDGDSGSLTDVVRMTFSPFEPLWTVLLGAVVGALLAVVAIHVSADARAQHDVAVAVRRCALLGLVLLLVVHGLDTAFRLGLQ